MSDRLCCLSYFDYKVWKHNYCALVNSKLFQSLIFPWNISFSKYHHFKYGKTLHDTPVFVIITEKLNSNSWWTDFDFWGFQLRFLRLFKILWRPFTVYSDCYYSFQFLNEAGNLIQIATIIVISNWCCSERFFYICLSFRFRDGLT